MQEYFSLLTATGANLLINAVANKTPVKLSKIAVSDSEIAPSEAAARLEDTKHEFAINSLTQDPQNPSILNIEGVIPSNVGGFNIRKFAIFTQNGEMFAVGRVPLSYKPALNQGAGSDLVFKIRILVGNVSNIELKVDNSVVLATRDWSEKTFQKLTDAIDAYSKSEADEKFALKTELQAGEFEPYNKALIDEIKITGIKDISLDPDPFKDGSGEALYNFMDGGKDLAGKHHSSTQLVIANEAPFGKALAGCANNGKSLGIDVDLKSRWTISFWANDRNQSSDRSLMAFNSGGTGTYRQFYHRAASSNEAIAARGWGLEKWNVIEGVDNSNSGEFYLKVTKENDDKWYHVLTTYDGEYLTYYNNGVKVGKVRVGAGVELKPKSSNAWVKGFNSNVSGGVLSQVRIFNRALTDVEAKTIYNEFIVEANSNTTLLVKATLLLCQGRNENGLFKNKAIALNAFASDASGLSDGAYYVKATQDNTLKLIKERPSIGAKSGASEYYLNGEWYSKEDVKLSPQTYLPYKATISGGKIVSLSKINLYPSDTGIGVNQTLQDVTAQRQANETYENTTGRPIELVIFIVSEAISIVVDGITIFQASGGGINRTITKIIPPNSTYKLSAVPSKWLELR